jgi:hypothetical protein
MARLHEDTPEWKEMQSVAGLLLFKGLNSGKFPGNMSLETQTT